MSEPSAIVLVSPRAGYSHASHASPAACCPDAPHLAQAWVLGNGRYAKPLEDGRRPHTQGISPPPEGRR
jgi:hypothetical protein